MPAYVLGEIRTDDPVTLARLTETYVPPALASIAAYGGRLIAGGQPEMLDGSPTPARAVVIEFPDAGAARRWYRSPEYQGVINLRLSSADGRVLLLDGAQ
ncbi:MAG TPA: DUF1330 domain-containing protein [Stellaceae bacterium]|nr:DUF1330 domain-containing protein [Stellaceae bacterium]